jgi:hypothetical protein
MLAMLFWVLAALAVVGALAIVWGLCTYWSTAGFSSEPRAGEWNTEGFPGPPTASEGQDRTGALGWGRRPNRPKTFAR